MRLVSRGSGSVPAASSSPTNSGASDKRSIVGSRIHRERQGAGTEHFRSDGAVLLLVSEAPTFVALLHNRAVMTDPVENARQSSVARNRYILCNGGTIMRS